MDEQAGLQEHQRTASVPPNSPCCPTHPPTHPHQRRESARATGRRTGPTAPGPQHAAGVRDGDGELVSSNKNTLLKVCVWGKWGCGEGEGEGEEFTGWSSHALELHPSTSSSLSNAHGQTLPVCVCWSVVGKGCLQMVAYWAPGFWRVGGLQGNGGGSGLLCFESCAALSLNGKGSE